MDRGYWLKMIGAANKEVDDRWIDAWPKLLSQGPLSLATKWNPAGQLPRLQLGWVAKSSFR
jgi:hypothetical protein